MAIAAIVAAQMLLLAHAFEHPVLDTQPCTTCLYCHNTGHALAATAGTVIAATVPTLQTAQPITNNALVATIQRSIRAPPRLAAMT